MPDRDSILGAAKPYMGAPYKFGGNSPQGTDCSGLTSQVYKSLGVNLPRTANDQYNATQRVPLNQTQAGDLLFLQGTQAGLQPGQASHVGIDTGDGNVLVSSSRHGVILQPKSKFLSVGVPLGAGRVQGITNMPANSNTPNSVNKSNRSGLVQAAPNGISNSDLSTLIQRSIGPDGRINLQNLQGSDPTQSDQSGYVPGMAGSQYYAPFQPTPGSMPHPGNAVLSALGLPAVLPDITYSTPSVASQRDTAEQNATQEKVGQDNTVQQDHLRALADLYKAKANVLDLNPSPDHVMPDYIPAPQRGYTDIPGREAPKYDLMSGILATLGGVVDPQSAGAYGNQPLQAGMSMAQQQYEDRIRHYNESIKLQAQQYEDALASRNDQMIYNRQKSDTAYQNALNKRSVGVDKGNLTAEQAAAMQQAGNLQSELPGAQKAAGDSTLAGQLSRTIQEQLQSNASRNQYDVNMAKLKEQEALGQARLFGNLYATQGRGDNNVNTNNTRESIAEGNNETKIKAANIYADSRVKAATIRASQANRASNQLNKLPPELRAKVDGARQIWAASEKEVIRAYRDADKMYGQDLQNKLPKDEYIKQYVNQFEQRAAAAKNQFDTAITQARVATKNGGSTPTTKPGSGSLLNDMMNDYIKK